MSEHVKNEQDKDAVQQAFIVAKAKTVKRKGAQKTRKSHASKSPRGAPIPVPPNTVWVSDIQIAEHYGVSRATVWRWASGWSTRNKHGDLIEHPPKIPRPKKVGANCSRWRWEDVKAALEG
jgi:predicted DNA-binding transcriptional regulator AlpA